MYNFLIFISYCAPKYFFFIILNFSLFNSKCLVTTYFLSFSIFFLEIMFKIIFFKQENKNY